MFTGDVFIAFSLTLFASVGMSYLSLRATKGSKAISHDALRGLLPFGRLRAGSLCSSQ
jgi:hypothetical protein